MSADAARSLTYYNLDVISSVGYRVRSKIASQFRIWATERLREHLVKGFTMDDELKRANSPVSAFVDAAELRAQGHGPTYMKDWLLHLGRLVTLLGTDLLTGRAALVGHPEGMARVELEYTRCRVQHHSALSGVRGLFLVNVRGMQPEIDGFSR